MNKLSSPAIYHVFSAGRKQATGSANLISDEVVADCSGAFDYIDQIIQSKLGNKASMIAIGEQSQGGFTLKAMPEFADMNSVRFQFMPIPYGSKEKKMLKKRFPASAGMEYWEWAFMKLIPGHHQPHAYDLVKSLLEDGYKLIFCKDQFANSRIVISTLRGQGKNSRADLLSIIQ